MVIILWFGIWRKCLEKENFEDEDGAMEAWRSKFRHGQVWLKE
jgi:hypothetical protein